MTSCAFRQASSFVVLFSNCFIKRYKNVVLTSSVGVDKALFRRYVLAGTFRQASSFIVLFSNCFIKRYKNVVLTSSVGIDKALFQRYVLAGNVLCAPLFFFR